MNGPTKDKHTGHRAQSEQPHEDPIVVGMGASAGGIEALKEFFSAVPEEPEVAFVVIQHLDPTHESMMSSLLSKYSSLAASQIVDGVEIEANRIYIIPPNYNVSVQGNQLRLTEQSNDRRASMAIDTFFRSLARARRERAIGVVLSGTMSDGTLGIRAIKEQAGMVMAQDPEEAQHDSMPRNAIATGMVDFVLPVAEMPEALLKYVRHSYVNGHTPEPEKQETQTTLQQILALIKARANHDFRFYKKSTLVRRVERRMGLNQIETMEHYLEHLRENGDEVHALAKDLRIGVTSFFREPEAWELLQREVIPRLFADGDRDTPVRVWVPGCSTGEEAYTLLMLLFEYLDHNEVTRPIQMFATDIDEEALSVARQGSYPKGIAADVSEARLGKFFTEEDDRYRVKKRLREAAVFVVQNVFSDAPFSNLDLISCRNLLIYLEPEIQQKILSLFHFSLRDERGYLLLGSSETVGANQDLFRRISKKWRIYERIGPHISTKVDFPIASGKGRRHPDGEQEGPGTGREQVERLERTTQSVLLRYFTPASVVVNRNLEILYLHGPVEGFLNLPQGTPRLDLGTMVKEGLRAKLRNAVHRAVNENESVHVDDARIRRAGHYQPCQIDVRPLRESKDFKDLFLVVFREKPRAEKPMPHDDDGGEADEKVVRQLEQELDETRQELQNTVEEYETTNEELKASNEEVMSMNEELQASNEELETSKEELQSLNEELNTVNTQLQDKVQELEASTNDLQNLMASTRIATLFLDPELQIRRFTPAAVGLFHLRDADVGRPIRELTQRFFDDRLEPDAREVLQELSPVQREVRSDNGCWYQRRILPFRTDTDRIEGVVITFVDVTKQKETEAALRESEERYRIMGEIVPYGTWLTDAEGKARYISPSWLDMVGRSFEEVKEFGWLSALVPEQRAEVKTLWKHSVETGEPFEHEHRCVDKGGNERVVLARGLPVRNDEGEITAWAGINLDITDRKRAEDALQEAVEDAEAANEAKSEFLARMSHEIRTPLNGVLGMVNLALLEDVDPKVREHLALAKKSANSLLHITNDILDLARIESGHVELTPAPFDLRQLLESVTSILTDAARKKGLRLSHDLDAAVPNTVVGDEGRLRQVLVNLVANAVKFTERGEVEVSVRQDGSSETQTDRVHLLFRVRDTGIGIPREQLSSIFEKFSQGTRSTHVEYGGTGLGLSIAEHLTELMGGTIWAESAEGEGSTFSFTAEFGTPEGAAAETRSTAAAKTQTVAPTQPLRILLAEDNAVNQLFAKTLLEQQGHSVTTAGDGRKALEALAREEFDVVLMDEQMPELPGTEVVRRIRRGEVPGVQRDLPIVALTAHALKGDRERFLETGMDEYLAKPIDPDEMNRVLARAIKT